MSQIYSYKSSKFYKQLKIKKQLDLKKIMAYGLLFTTKYAGVPGTHLIYNGRMKG